MTPMGVYSIYMGVRYIGINGVYHIYHSTLLSVFPDEVAWLAGFMMYDDFLDINLYDRLTV
jgi:hypothetical protein